MTKLHVATAAACLCCGAAIAQPLDLSGGAWRIGGFGTLGLVHVDGPDGWGFRRDISQPADDRPTRPDVDSRLGLQLNYAPSAQFEMVGQLLARRRAGGAGASDSLELAFAAYRPSPELELRVGRVNADLYAMSDHRSVGFAYPYVRPPVDFYANMAGCYDGVDITRTWNSGGATYRAKGYVGRAAGGDLSQSRIISIAPVLGLTLTREANGLTLRAALVRATLRDDVSVTIPLLQGLRGVAALPVPEVAAQAQALHDRLSTKDSRLGYAAFGLRYELDAWELRAEYTHVSGTPVARFDAAYASVGRRIGEVTLYGMASLTQSPDLPARTPAWDAALSPLVGPQVAAQAQALAAGATEAVNRSGATQHTFSLGARWDLHPQMALKLQYDRVRIGANGGRLWTGASTAPGRAHIATAALDFVF